MREKMKGMTFLQKVDYLWTYYKIWLLVPVVIGFVLYIGVSAYRAKQQNVLVNAVVVGSTMQETETLQQEIKQYMHSDRKNDVVTIMTNVPNDHMGQTSTMALSTMVGARTVDVVIGTEEVYQYFGGEEAGLIPLEEVLGEKADQLADRRVGNALLLKQSDEITKKLGIPYEEAYVMVLKSAPHQNGAVQFVQYVFDNL